MVRWLLRSEYLGEYAILRTEFVKLVENLPVTCYAVLGVLAVKERTAYELAREVQHCFEYFWPRADARVYEDAKRLATLGLATATQQRIGKRPRTTYAITPAGRDALAAWLARPAKPVALEFEALLKVYLARFGTREQLLATLEQICADAAYMLRVAALVRGVYLEGCAPFQDEYVHIWAFIYDFLVDYFRLLHTWAERSHGIAAGWHDLAPEGKREQALALFDQKRPPRGHRPSAAGPSGAEDVPAMPGLWRRWGEARQGTSEDG